MNIKTYVSMVLLLSSLSFISTCDQVDFYDFAKTGGIGPDEKTFVSFSINGYEAQIDNVNMVIAISVPTGMDVTSPVTRFSIRGDYVLANGIVIGSGTTSINYSTTAAFTVFALDATSQNYTVTITYTGTLLP